MALDEKLLLLLDASHFLSQDGSILVTASYSGFRRQASGADYLSAKIPRMPCLRLRLQHWTPYSLRIDREWVWRTWDLPVAHEKTTSTVRVMFFDFSSAFITLWPRLQGDKLSAAQVDSQSSRLLLPRCRKERFYRSFHPAAIRSYTTIIGSSTWH